MEMQEIAVGKRYPMQMTWPPVEGACYTFDASGHTLRMFYPGVKGDEVRDVRRGTARFAVVYEAPVLFLLYRFGTQSWGDAPFTVHLVSEEGRRTKMFDPEQGGIVNALQVHLVDTRSGITKALKMYGLPDEFMLAIEDGIQQQLAAGWSGRADYGAALDGIYRRYSTEDLLAKATYATVFWR